MPAKHTMFRDRMFHTVDADAALLADPIEVEDRLIATSIESEVP